MSGRTVGVQADWAAAGELVAFPAGNSRPGRMLDGFYRSPRKMNAPLLVFVHGMGSNFYRSGLKKAFLEAAPANRSRRNSKRRLERKHVPLLVLVQFIAYAFYESGIPSSCNIRIDLIPIVPALAAAAIVAIRSLFPPKKTEQGSAP